MILRHRDTPLLHFDWISSDEVRVDSVDERLLYLLPLSFASAARENRQALEHELTTWLCRRTAPIFGNGYGLFSLMTLPENHATDEYGEYVERLRGFRFHRHQHYNLPADRLALIERFLQKRISDILRYLDKADEYVHVSEGRVGVNSKKQASAVGVKSKEVADAKALECDPLALQILWNLKANPLMTMVELSSVLGRQTRTVERWVRKLRDAKHIRRTGSDKAGAWEVLI